MLSYCLECKNNTGSQDSKVSKTSNGKIMLLSMYAQCAIAKNPDLPKSKSQVGY